MTDYITSSFQVGAIIFLCFNIRRLYIDGELKGVSIWMISFFTLWGYWGIHMYTELHQFWSMVTNIGIALAYTAWLALALFIKLMEKIDRN